MPLFILTLPTVVKAVLQAYGRDGLRPGDVLISNDPWLCAGHLPDVAIVTPIFRGARLVAFAASIGHVSDIGGTKDVLGVREIYDEGLQIPPLRLYRAGGANEDVIRLISAT